MAENKGTRTDYSQKDRSAGLEQMSINGNVIKRDIPIGDKAPTIITSHFDSPSRDKDGSNPPKKK